MCACVCTDVCLVCMQFQSLKQSRGQSPVCTNVKCVCGCVVSWIDSANKAIKRAETCMFRVCVCARACVSVCVRSLGFCGA